MKKYERISMIFCHGRAWPSNDRFVFSDDLDHDADPVMKSLGRGLCCPSASSSFVVYTSLFVAQIEL